MDVFQYTFRNLDINEHVIIDARTKSGSVDLTGLFIKDGPVVQVKQSNGSIEVEDDPDPSISYEGPLVVLINRLSASASEIFSGAIQNYGRGLIVGETRSGMIRARVGRPAYSGVHRHRAG